ncbi:uncharacterized protein LOC135708974 [Ochlerotatus camptorhynchus]|uniref:uncharacterized protein LOC135708974 n=1 Tax=Ochlerotatus camptorhynchus TaxID=644619 RepID=UPI0031DDBFF7
MATTDRLEELLSRFWSIEEVELINNFSPEESRCEAMFATHQCSSKVLLATAAVIVQDDDGNRIPARALLDSGSESNFISERLSQRLKITRRIVDISVLGIGQAATKVKQQVSAMVRSRLSEYSRQMNFLVLPKVTVNLPTTTINTSGWTLPEGIELADPSFCISSGVDIVLGIEAFFDFFEMDYPRTLTYGNSTFMEKNVQLGHMRKVEGAQGSIKRCFLPHHPVVKEASTTTKVRVVFDASCKTSTGLSLNDALLVGPVLQQDLRSIILRCCTKQIILVADVEKMFRQIFVISIDRPLQSIFWRPSPSEEVGIYELNTVTYGTKPAPFLATRTLNQLVMDEGDRYPLAVAAVTEDTYMDDVITGCDTLEEAKKLQIQLDGMMSSGGFQLRKWASNCAGVLHGVPEENLAIRASEGINLDPDPSVKALGLTWLPNSDVFRFQFDIPPINPDEVLTKRRVLSIIATLFDPLGFIGATITAAKVFMQILWTLEDEDGKRLHWDKPIPSTVGESWRKFHIQLPILNDIRIDRCVIIPQAMQIEIHCFSDASMKAYGGCLYIRSQDQDGNVKVQLLTSKSKVAPLKSQSIPRLELCGALLAAQVLEKVLQATKLTVRTTFWVDSTCALRWIQASPSNWSVFVANRVAKIQAITEGCEWRHIAGADNPADLVSRGIGPKDILNNNFWWHGPSWLAQDRNTWPISVDTLPEEEYEDEKRRTAVVSFSG